MVAEGAGRAAVAFCNATAADINSGYSVNLNRVPK